MKDSASSMGGMPDHTERNESNWQHIEVEDALIGTSEGRLFLDYLADQGFAWEEALKLINLREHLYEENVEMQQRLADDCRMHFARWLYEQGEIKEA
jgi:hypothetical protein